MCTIFINRQRIIDNNRSAIEVDTDHIWLIQIECLTFVPLSKVRLNSFAGKVNDYGVK